MSPWDKEGKLKHLVGKSPAFLAAIENIPVIAKADSSVLICGETGTGKEVVAKTIHQLSSRPDKPFIPVNCGAIPPELAENEMFGHRGGAFTGASAYKPGLISDAEGGTLFLDEIDSLPLMVQVKLLRFLQEKTYRPLGSTKEHLADVRIITASGTEPEEMVRSGKLRQDLYYRLNILTIKLPTLKERAEDIPLLANHFLAMYKASLHKRIKGFSQEAMRKLLFYDWPGNVRELQHTVERAVVFCETDSIRPPDLNLPHLEEDGEREPFLEAKQKLIQQFEVAYIRNLLAIYQGNISKAAKAAQKHRRAFYELIKKYRIDVEAFKSNHES